MDAQDQNIQAYIQKILSIQNQQANRPLSDAEMKSIASNLGISAQDWEAIQRAFENYRMRGQGYINHKNPGDAIQEFEQALTIRPGDLQSLFGLAQAYELRWQASRRAPDRQKAEDFAKQCLNIKANHQGALELISNLKGLSSLDMSTPIPNSAKKSSSRMILIATASIGVFIAAIISFILIPESNSSQESNPVITEVSSSEEDNSEPPLNENYLEDGDRAVKVNFIAEELQGKIDLEVESSQLVVYNDSYSYKFKGELFIKGVEIDQLKVKVELLDENGEVVVVKNEEFVKDYVPILRSGDQMPVYFTSFQKDAKAPQLKEARLRVYMSDYVDSEVQEFDASPAIPLEWAIKKPSNFDLELRERLSNFESLSYQKGKSRHELVLEVFNQGKGTIESLKIQIEWLDASGKVLGSKDKIVNYSSMPKFSPEELRLIWFFETVQVPMNQIKNYKISVIEIS